MRGDRWVVWFAALVLADAYTLLDRAAAAAGIALINSIGNLGGYIGPFIVGRIKDSTKSFEMGLYFLAACAFASAAITYFAMRKADVWR